ncbi:MAG: hypothetical protein C4346_03775 [Chloroflexota bacterium]
MSEPAPFASSDAAEAPFDPAARGGEEDDATADALDDAAVDAAVGAAAGCAVSSSKETSASGSFFVARGGGADVEAVELLVLEAVEVAV